MTGNGATLSPSGSRPESTRTEPFAARTVNDRVGAGRAVAHSQPMKLVIDRLAPGRFLRAFVRVICVGSRHSRRPKPGILKVRPELAGQLPRGSFFACRGSSRNPVADLTPARIFRRRGCEGGPFCRTVPALPSDCRGLPNLGSETTDRRRRSRSLRGPDVTAPRSRPARRRN